MYKALDLAYIIIDKQKRNRNEINNLQLNKILFWWQKEYIKFTGKLLFEDPIDISQYGMFIPNIYDEFKNNGILDMTYIVKYEDLIIVDKEADIIIDSILNVIGGLSACELSVLNKNEKIYKICFSNILDNDKLLECYLLK